MLGIGTAHWRHAVCALGVLAFVCTPLNAEEDVDAGSEDQAGEAAKPSQGGQKTASSFGSRAAILSISLSPSGKKIAYIGPDASHGEYLNIVDLENGAAVKTISANSQKVGDLSWCEWATETRLLCQLDGRGETGGVIVPFDRLFAIDDDGSDAVQVSTRRSVRARNFNQFGGDVVALDVEGEAGSLLVTRNHVNDSALALVSSSVNRTGLGIDLLDIETKKRKTRERPDEKAVRYIADDKGIVRLKTRMLTEGLGNDAVQFVYLYRPEGETKWEPMGNVILDGKKVSDFVPRAVDNARNVAIGFTSLNGFTALAEVALDGSGKGRILLARDDADVDELIRIGRQRRVVGASYATEKRNVEYFDPEIAKIARGLNKALPNQPLIDIVGASSDENRLLIAASSDTDPGMVYLFDKTSRKLEPLLPMRDIPAEQTLGAMKPVVYPAKDGTQIPGYLTLPANSEGKRLPAIVLPHGGPAARDYWGFDWLVQFFTARGYAVMQPNYRGSAGYGAAWFGRNGYQAWDVAIGDVNDAARWMVSEGIADPEKLAIVGWSYGGYAALQSQVVEPELFKAVAAIAPVTDLEFLRQDARGYVGFRARDKQLGNGPHIAAGSPKRHADKFKAPVALFHGTLDLNVEVKHSRAMARELRKAGKTVAYTEFEDLEHSLRDSQARTRMLGEIDAFLTKALGR